MSTCKKQQNSIKINSKKLTSHFFWWNESLLCSFSLCKHGLTLTSNGHVGIQSNDHIISTKIDIFCQNQCLNRRVYLGPTDVFSTRLAYDCSSALNNEVPGDRVHLISKTVVLQWFCQKNHQNRAKTALFCFFWLGHLRRWDEVHFLPREFVVQRTTTEVSTWAFWKKVWRAEVSGPNLRDLG